MDITVWARSAGLAVIAVLSLATAPPARAGTSWALPLIGGALGGYAISSLVQSRQAPPAPAHHASPPPPAHASRPATPEARLQQLDQLAAKGLITPAEYQQRRQAIIATL